jgi:enoyl-CoA hydratase
MGYANYETLRLSRADDVLTIEPIAEGRRTIIDLLEIPQPIVAAVNGPAIGLGATFTGEKVSAERALEIGLINHVVAPEELDEFVHGMARRLAATPRAAVRGTKASMNKCSGRR